MVQRIFCTTKKSAMTKDVVRKARKYKRSWMTDVDKKKPIQERKRTYQAMLQESETE